jgi:integrase
MEWALYTGAREFEICDLLADSIPPQSAYRSRRAYPISIIGKHGVKADLYVPTWLLDKTYQYIRFFVRADIVRALKGRGKVAEDELFLGRWGKALQPNSVYKAFKDALERVGLRGTFHDLRHTYAISTLDKLMRLPRHEATDGMNALLELKHLLRHGSLESTMVYLKARNFYLTEIYSDLFDLPESYAT